jgi:hypothetical protein
MSMFFFIVLLISFQNSFLVIKTLYVWGFFSKKNIRIPNVAEKNILILVEEKKII